MRFNTPGGNEPCPVNANFTPAFKIDLLGFDALEIEKRRSDQLFN
jgi:hypothetical protein